MVSRAGFVLMPQRHTQAEVLRLHHLRVAVADEYVLGTDSMKFLYSGEQPDVSDESLVQ